MLRSEANITGFLGEKKNSGVVTQAELGLAHLRADDLLSRTKLRSREKRAVGRSPEGLDG